MLVFEKIAKLQNWRKTSRSSVENRKKNKKTRPQGVRIKIDCAVTGDRRPVLSAKAHWAYSQSKIQMNMHVLPQ